MLYPGWFKDGIPVLFRPGLSGVVALHHFYSGTAPIFLDAAYGRNGGWFVSA